MPRLPRVHVQGAIYYVTLRGSQSQEIFKEKADYAMYLELLAKYKAQHHFKLYSYCLLPGQLHLLVETTGEATISEIMHDLNSLYTKYFNGRYDKRGHLFESRFKSVLVEKANYLLEMSRYVHQAPEKVPVAIAGGLENTPRMWSYPYSSYKLYLSKVQENGGPSTKNMIDISEEVHELMGFLRASGKGLSYERYCLSGDQAEMEELDKRLRRGSVLGSDSFETQVRQKVEECSKAQRGGATGARTVKRPSGIFIFIIGVGILLAVTSATYLYVSKKSLEEKYSTLLAQKEAEFFEKSRFENRSPLALSDLEGTVWEIETLPLSGAKSPEVVKDHLRFSQGRFSSDNYSALGFGPTNFSRTAQPGGGVVIWETIQSNAAGDTVSWRGDWQGDAMKGVLSVKPATKASAGPSEGPTSFGGDFSFFSVKWNYAEIGK